MAGPIRISILADARNALQAMRQAGAGAQTMGSRISSVGGAIKGTFVAAGAAVVASGLVEGFKKTIDAGAELQANIGATKQVFGEAAAEVLKFGDAAAQSLGVSKAEALGAAKQFGAFYTAIGFTNKQAAQMSTKFTDAAGNLAAFGDSTPTEALEAMTSALRGEYDPLQKYVPTVNAAAVEQKAMALTGKKNAKALTEQEKALALQALVYDSVANKAGKAERAQGGYTQEMSKLKAQLTDIGAKIGSALLPGLTKAASFVNDRVIPAFKQLSEKYGPAIKTFFSGVGSLVSSFKMPSFESGGLSGVIDSVKGLTTTVTPMLKIMGSTISSTFTSLLPKIKPIFENIKATVQDVFITIQQIVRGVTAVITYIWTNFGSNIVSFIRTALTSVVAVISGAFQIIRGLWQVISGILTGDWSKAWNGVKNILRGAVAILLGLFNIIKAAVGLLGTVALRLLSAAWNAIKSVTSSVWNSIKSYLSGVWSSIKSSVSSSVNSVRSAISSAWNTVRTSTSNAWNSFKSTISNAVSNAVTTVRNMASNIVSAVSGLASRMVSAGRDAIQGFISGMAGMLGSVISKARDIASAALNAAKNALGIASPSKAFRALGRFAGLGFIEGLTSTTAKVIGTVKSLAGKVESAFGDAISYVYTGKGKNRKRVRVVKGNKVRTALLQMLDRESPRLIALTKRRDAIGSLIAAQSKRVVDLQKARADVVASVAESIRGSFKLVTDGATSLGSIMARSNRAVADATRFAANLATLRSRGLNANLLNELAAGGVTAGGAAARSLLNATGAQIQLLNNNFATLGKVGSTTGNTIGGALYDAGIKAAQGLANGLLKERKSIELTMVTIAKSMQSAIRRALGIKSPSTVFRKLGEQTIRGFAAGFRTITGEQLGRTFTSGLASINPVVPSYSYASASPSRGTTPPITVNFNGVVGDPVEVGRQIAKVSRAYSDAIGR